MTDNESPPVSSSRSHHIDDDDTDGDVFREADLPCSICRETVITENNDMLRCHGPCKIVVHQACYGVEAVPKHAWYCKRCEPHSLCRSSKKKCAFCPVKEGAIKHTTSNGWSHIVCALFVDELSFCGRYAREMVNDSLLPAKRLGKAGCVLCQSGTSNAGVSVQCSFPGCTRRVHASCAHAADLTLFRASKTNPAVRVGAAIVCPTHKNKLVKKQAAASEAQQQQHDEFPSERKQKKKKQNHTVVSAGPTRKKRGSQSQESTLKQQKHASLSSKKNGKTEAPLDHASRKQSSGKKKKATGSTTEQSHWFCEICDRQYASQHAYNGHLAGRRHALLAESSAKLLTSKTGPASSSSLSSSGHKDRAKHTTSHRKNSSKSGSSSRSSQNGLEPRRKRAKGKVLDDSTSDSDSGSAFGSDDDSDQADDPIDSSSSSNNSSSGSDSSSNSRNMRRDKHRLRLKDAYAAEESSDDGDSDDMPLSSLPEKDGGKQQRSGQASKRTKGSTKQSPVSRGTGTSALGRLRDVDERQRLIAAKEQGNALAKTLFSAHHSASSIATMHACNTIDSFRNGLEHMSYDEIITSFARVEAVQAKTADLIDGTSALVDRIREARADIDACKAALNALPASELSQSPGHDDRALLLEAIDRGGDEALDLVRARREKLEQLALVLLQRCQDPAHPVTSWNAEDMLDLTLFSLSGEDATARSAARANEKTTQAATQAGSTNSKS